MIAVWKIAAALVCGCTVVVKPSEYTPLTLLRLAELASECGFPPGVINVVNGPGGELGPALIGHESCAKVSFTGSVATGNAVSRSASAQGKRVTLELGGKNAALFLDDLSVTEIVNGILEAGYLNQGQICAAAECFWLPADKIDAVLDALKVRLNNTVIGSPLDETTAMGPLANRAQLDKISDLLAIARREGDEIVCGGETLEGSGYFLRPTAVRVASASSTLMKEETFGPVGSFIAYEDAEQALQNINASPLAWPPASGRAISARRCVSASGWKPGLSGSICTRFSIQPYPLAGLKALALDANSAARLLMITPS